MTPAAELGDRALALVPAPDVPRMDLVLTALGIGTAATVVVSTGEQIVRLVAQQRVPALAGETLAAAVAVLVVCLARGLDRSVLAVVVVHALSLAGTFGAALITYAYLGRRAVGDPLAQLGPAYGSLIVGAAVAAAVGTLGRAALPPSPRADGTPLLPRAVGVAIVAGVVVHLVWPTPLFAAVSGATRPDDVRAVLISLPDLLVGSIAGGVYAAQRGAGYVALLAVGALLAVPSLVAQLALARVQGASDPSVRAAYAVLFLLLAVRIAAWPLAAAFVHGFLTPPESATSVSRRYINEP